MNSYALLAENVNEKYIKGQSFNFGNDKPLKVLDIVNTIQKLTKKEKLKPKILNIAKGEIKDQYLNSKKAHKLLKWKPKYTLEQGLKETIEWYKNFFKK